MNGSIVNIQETVSDYEFYKEGTQIACGSTEQIEVFANINEAGCKDKCDEYKSCSYFWTNSTNLECILYSSCDTMIDHPLSSGKLFKKKQSYYHFYNRLIYNYEIKLRLELI